MVNLNGNAYAKTDFRNFEWVDKLLALGGDFVAEADSKIDAITAAVGSVVANNGYAATSTSNHSLSTGAKSFVIEANKFFGPGAPVIIVDTADAGRYLYGFVTNYSGTSLLMDIVTANGSGSNDSWNVHLAGVPGDAAPLDPNDVLTKYRSVAEPPANLIYNSTFTGDGAFTTVSGVAIPAVKGLVGGAYSLPSPNFVAAGIQITELTRLQRNVALGAQHAEIQALFTAMGRSETGSLEFAIIRLYNPPGNTYPPAFMEIQTAPTFYRDWSVTNGHWIKVVSNGGGTVGSHGITMTPQPTMGEWVWHTHKTTAPTRAYRSVTGPAGSDIYLALPFACLGDWSNMKPLTAPWLAVNELA